MPKQAYHRINAGRVAVRSQVRYFRSHFAAVGTRSKHDRSVVTFVDFAITEHIFKQLREQFCDDHYCSEESDPAEPEMVLQKRFTWVLDPVDGTENYAIGIPSCAISLALLEYGEPIYGFVYDYGRDCLWEGGGEYGLLCDGKKYEVSEGVADDDLVALHVSRSVDLPHATLGKIWTQYRSRYLGSGTLSLTYVAVGWFSGSFDLKVKPWDIAAAYALLRARGLDCHFLGQDIFPLERFHPHMASCPYYAGSSSFCEKIGKVLASA